MAISISSLPPDLAWLRTAYRPCPQEIDTYAPLIADAEGRPWPSEDSHLREEAELQLWIWRTETRTKSRSRDATPRAQQIESASAVVQRAGIAQTRAVTRRSFATL